MSEPEAFAHVVRSIVADPGYAVALAQQIEARTADAQLVERLIAYARSREVTAGHAKARKLLTDAGVSWEAL